MAPKDPIPTAVTTTDKDDFFASLRMGLLLGAAALVIVLPAWHFWKKQASPAFPNVATQVVQAPAAPPVSLPPTIPGTSASEAPRKLAWFGDHRPTDEVRLIANWSAHSGDHEKMGFVIVDKKDARVWVFGPDARVLSSTPALMGSAIGDDSVPGIGEKPLSQVRPEERTTPAGRFIAEPGNNHTGEDIVWVSYDLAVSMHRLRPSAKVERRPERLASATAADNRISFGCINLPPKFYETVLSPTVNKYGAVVYVLPETRSAAQVFGAYDVTTATRVAQR